MSSIKRVFDTVGDEYEYRSLVASEWDRFRPDAADWPDIPLYRSLIEDGGQPALDVACATGRLVLRFCSEGMDVDGVDISPEMLEICHSKAREMDLKPGLFLQAMQELDLPRKYRTIIVSSSSFALLTDLKDSKRALAKFFAHLEVGGKLVMTLPLYRPDSGGHDWSPDAEHEREDGTIIRRFHRSWSDSEAMLGHAETRFEVVRDGEVIETELHRRSPEIRLFTPELAESLLTEAGFAGPDGKGCEITGGFSGHPLKNDDQYIVVVASRP